MGTSGYRRFAVAAASASLLLMPACNAIFGVDGLTYTAAGAGGGGQGGAGDCDEGASRACYEGPSQTEGVGRCDPGEQSCTNASWGPCVGQVLPDAESCASSEDEDCDGFDCGDVVWARGLGGPGEELAWDVAARSDGTLAVAGHYGPMAELDEPALPEPAVGDVSAFVALLEETGQTRWARGFGGTGKRRATDVAVTPTGGIVVLGTFDETIELGDGLVASAGAEDVFVAAFSPEGELWWRRVLGSAGPEDAYELVVDSDGGVVIGGSYGGALNVGSVSLPAATDRDAFLLRLDASGKPTAVTLFGGTGDELVRSVTLHDDGDVTAVGYFSQTLVVDNNPFTATGGADAFAVRMTDAGETRWVRAWGGDGIERLFGVATSGDDGDVIVGEFEGTVDFDGTPLTSFGGDDVLVLKMTSGGQLAWAKRFGDVGQQWGFGVAVDDGGAIHVAGHYETAISFGSDLHTGAQTQNLFYARFDGGGALERSRGFPLSAQAPPPLGWPGRRRITIAPEGDVVIATHLTGRATFDDAVVTSIGGSNDALLLRLAR